MSAEKTPTRKRSIKKHGGKKTAGAGVQRPQKSQFIHPEYDGVRNFQNVQQKGGDPIVMNLTAQ